MRLKNYSFLLVGAILLCLLVGWNAKGQAPSIASTVYEYKIIRTSDSDLDIEKRLNELGMQKWELVTVQSEPSKGGTAYYLKRGIKIVTHG